MARRFNIAALTAISHVPASEEAAWLVQTDESWAIQKRYGGGEGHRVYLEAPLSSEGKSLKGGEKLVFRRSFTGVKKGESTIELSQKLIHALCISSRSTKAIMTPLSKLHALRSTSKAHSSVEAKRMEERQARATHGTLRAHFKHLAGECDKAFVTILAALGAGDLNS